MIQFPYTKEKGRLTITGLPKRKVKIIIIDAIGRKVYEDFFWGKPINQLKQPLSISGTYAIRISMSKKLLIRRIVII